MASITIEILGEPVGKGRPRFKNMGKFGRPYTPERTVSYENLVKEMYYVQCKGTKLEGELRATIYAYLKIPKSTSKKKTKLMLDQLIRPTKAPDVDNIAKIVLDSLNNLAYDDDKQVVELVVKKFYSDNPRTEVYIEEIV